MSAPTLRPLPQAAPRPVYALRGTSQVYDGRAVLSIDSLVVHEGEVLALVGPSGAGKSTLLRLLAFLEDPAGGELSFDGRSCDGSWPDLAARRRVTMVVQPPQLLRRSVTNNIVYGLRVRGARQTSQAVAAAIDDVGLTNLAGAFAPSLSSGERQRVALARALVLQPDVLLLDEPTANLDPANIHVIEQAITHANDRGTTVVLVTHNLFQARRLAQRIGLLVSGQLIEVAAADDFFQRPRHRQTEAFVRGDMIY